MAKPALHLSGDPDADALLSSDPLALLIGMVLDQQIPLEWAFRGPATLAVRLGMTPPLDAGRLAAIDPAALAAAFSAKPALHRYPGSMAARVQSLCRTVADTYGGDASAIWNGAGPDGEALRRRVQALPGFAEHKARIFVALLGKQLDVRPPGWEAAAGRFGEPGTQLSVADIVDAASLAEVRAAKQRAKAAATAATAAAGPASPPAAPRRAERRR